MAIPLCSNIPSCGQRHVGACASPLLADLEPTPPESLAAKIDKIDFTGKRSAGSAIKKAAKPPPPKVVTVDLRSPLDKLQEQVDKLEKRVHWLENTRRKRRTYMRKFMAKKYKKKQQQA